jgi:proline iminopeptidase
MLRRVLRLIAFFPVLWAAQSSCQASLIPGEHDVVLNGVRLWYKVAGQARPGQAPLVFLHGGPGYNSYSFEKTIGAKLEDHAQMIYFDERGSGRSERPWTKNYEMASLTQDLEALRKSLGIPQISLIGHSFGGTIALEYAARYPDQVQKLIILDGAADLPKAIHLWRTQLEQRYSAAWQEAMSGEQGKRLQQTLNGKDSCAISKAEFAVEMETLGKVDAKEFRHWEQFHDRRYQEEQDALDAASGLRNTGELSNAYFETDSQFLCYRFAAYGKLTMPVLVMVGKYDGAVGVEQMRDLAGHLPRARFDEFDQSAHFVYAEEPEKFTRDVAAFLAE